MQKYNEIQNGGGIIADDNDIIKNEFSILQGSPTPNEDTLRHQSKYLSRLEHHQDHIPLSDVGSNPYGTMSKGVSRKTLI